MYPVVDIDAIHSKRFSRDSGAMRVGVADLTTLHVSISELRVTPGGKWLYVLQVTCGNLQWQMIKRYSEIREFWTALRHSVIENEHSCPEKCHFLAGFENDKFPKKHVLHTKNKLEARANELDVFFVKLALRLNLCNRLHLERCCRQGCSLLQLLTGFFEIGAHPADNDRQTCCSTNPYGALASYRKMPLLDNQQHRHSSGGRSNFKKKYSKKDDRRFSFTTLQDVRVVVEPQDA